MVRKALFVLFICLFSFRAYAAEFTATVDSNDVGADEGFTLELTLSGTQAQGDPDTAALERSFTVAGEGQTSSTSIVNGTVTSNVGWVLTLIPKKPGQLTIPPVTIQTKDGMLSTQPVNIQVGRAAPAAPQAQAPDPGRRISVAAYVDTDEPYQNQAIHYTVKIVTRAAVTDLALDDLAVEGAVIDKSDKPAIGIEVQNGQRVRVVEFSYVITPLQPGHVSIPAPVLHGTVEGEPARFPYQSGRDLSDPFAMMRAFPMFDMEQPFRASGNQIDLDVKPPAMAMTPWLPLYSLQIKDEWKGLENARVGEPITHEIMLLADGGTGGQLPGLDDKQNRDDFKVYADKATTNTEQGKEGERISGWRRESYTLIPKKDGKLVIPAIKVPWWDVSKNAVAYAELPEKVIDVAPGAQASSTPPPVATAGAAPVRQSAAATVAERNNPPLVLYAIIGLLLGATLMIAVWAFRLQRKVSGLVNKTGPAPPSDKAAPPEPVSLEALGRITTPEKLKSYIQAYAAQHWGAPANAPLAKIPALAPSAVRKDAAIVVKALTAALYGGRPADMDMLRLRVSNFRPAETKKKKGKKSSARLPDLNPS